MENIRRPQGTASNRTLSLERETEPRSSNRGLKLRSPSMKLLVGLVFIVQLLILGLLVVLINPASVFEQLDAIKVINVVSRKSAVPPSEVPVLARVGDNKLLPDIKDLREQNDINAEVYKDAQNGDYVLGFSSKLIIYRMTDDRVIYEGDTPQKILENTQQVILTNVVKKAKDRGLIADSSTETPQVAVVTDVDALKTTNPTFYANVQQGDILATFPGSSVVVLYRPSTDTVVNAGNFSTSINTL